MIEFENNGWKITASYRRAMPNWWTGDPDDNGYQGGIRTRLYVQIRAVDTRITMRANNLIVGGRGVGVDGMLRSLDLSIEHARVYDEESRGFVLGLASLVDNIEPKWHNPWRMVLNPKVRCMHTHGPTMDMTEGEPLPMRGIAYALSMALLDPPGVGAPYDVISGNRSEQPVLARQIIKAIRRQP